MVPNSLGSTSTPSRPRRWRGTVPLLLAFLAPLALAACAGGGSGGGGAPLKSYADFDLASTSPRTCDTLALSAASGQPLDTVTISGLPAAFGQIAVYVETDPGGVGLLTPTGPVSGGEAEFRVPVAPDGSADGGAVRLTVTDATEACPAVAFTIDPLPPAPASYDAYMADLGDAVRTFLDMAAQSYGSSYAELSGASTPPDNAFLPIYLAIRIFEATLETPPADLTDAEKELVVRLLAKAGALAAFTDVTAALDQWLADFGATTLSAPAAPTKPATPAGVRRAKDDGCRVLDPPQIDIPSTERLSEIMSNPAMDTISGAAGSFGSAMAAISSALGAIGASGPTDVLGALASVTAMVADYARSVAPSAFTSLTFDVESPIWEDMSPDESSWSNAQANVTSTPFSITRAVAQQLITLAGFAGLPGWAITVITYSYDDEVNTALADVATNETLCVSIGAQEWGPFDVTSSDWTESEVLGTAITKKTHNTYLPAMLGQSELRVRIRPEKFGGATIAANNFVTVNAKTVSISPISPKVDKPGDPVHLQVSVNAHFPEAVEWTPPAGAGEVAHVYQGDGIHTFDFASPGSENLFPAPFRVASTSGEVPPNTFERADSVNILLNTGLQITGQRNCISPGETVNLEAVLSGFSDPDAQVVTWTKSAGTIVAQSPTRLAAYTAPLNLGTVTVRAETPAPGIGTEPLSDQVEMLVSDSCLRQFFTAYLISTADGDPDCDGPLALRADIPEEADSVDSFEDYAGNHLPAPQGDYFGTGSVSLATQSSFVESRAVTRGGVGQCETMLPSAQGRLDISSVAEGTAEWHADFTNRGTCTTDDSGPICNVGETGYVVGHYIYLPIEAPGTYRLTVDMACTLYPHYGDLQVFVTRWVDGTDATLPNGPDSTPTPQNPQPAVPFVPPLIGLGFECDGLTHSPFVDLDLVGPLGISGADLVTINYFAGPIGSTAALTPQETQENNDAADPFAQGQSPEFIHTLDATVKLERLN